MTEPTTMSVCVCAKCKTPWEMSNSPAICSLCKQVSFGIAIPKASASAKKPHQDPEYRAKLSAATKKLWQDPEYRARMSATSKKLWQDPEYRARMSATSKKLWQDHEYRAKMSAAAKNRGKTPKGHRNKINNPPLIEASEVDIK